MSLSICWCCGKATLQADIDRACDPATPSAELFRLWDRPYYTCQSNPVLHAIARNPNIDTTFASMISLSLTYVPDLLANPALDLWIMQGFPGWGRFDLGRLLATAEVHDDPHVPALKYWADLAHERWWRAL